MEEKYTLTLSDGTEMKDLKMNGNNFIAPAEVKESDFEGKLMTVEVSNGEETQVMSNCDLVQITKVGNEWWFVLREMTDEELRLRKMSANIDYIAMMTDVDI